MASSLPEPSPAPKDDIHSFFDHDQDDDDDDADTASQRSISLSSPTDSPRNSALNNLARHASLRDSYSYSKRESHPYTIDTDFGSDRNSTFSHVIESQDTPSTSAAPSVYEEPKEVEASPLATYPPSVPDRDDRMSIASFASGSSRKTRPESLIIKPPNGPLILGIALVDFNHLIGPRIEYSKGDILENEEVAKILPFLALPDGAHLSAEDYSYFHIVPSGPNPTTIFGISCNQQIAASALLVKGDDVTRSIVQKAVVVLASKPIFGPIRAKLGVVTTALFNQKDFTDSTILEDFANSLEHSIRGQLTESGLYIGTSLRELVHTFRHKTLTLVKALILQKRIMFYGHPVERLCTYQYSLISLLPGLLQTLEDCGSPPLASRAPTLSRPTSLKTSDSKSMMAYMGLPLDIFGKDAFFQPYIPLQQLDLLVETKSWLCGSTNSILAQQKDIDLLVNLETGSFEYHDAKLERSAGLTPADRKWMDDIVNDVKEGWDDANPKQAFQFKGSDDYLRSKFEEYIFAALSSVKYQDFVSKGEVNGVIITGTGGYPNSTEDFNPLWISEFKKTNAFEVWDRITDPTIFDIVEPRHPCSQKPSVVADFGLRLQEGIQDLKLDQQLAPAREAVASAWSVGSTNFFKAVEGVRERWNVRREESIASTNTTEASKNTTGSSTTVDVSKSDAENNSPHTPEIPAQLSTPLAGIKSFMTRHASISSMSSMEAPAQSQRQQQQEPPAAASPSRPSLSSWGAGIGSFLSSRTSKFTLPHATAAPAQQQEEQSINQGAPVTAAAVNGQAFVDNSAANNAVSARKTMTGSVLTTSPTELSQTSGQAAGPEIPRRDAVQLDLKQQQQQDTSDANHAEPPTPRALVMPTAAPSISVTSPGSTTSPGLPSTPPATKLASPTTPRAPRPVQQIDERRREEPAPSHSEVTPPVKEHDEDEVAYTGVAM